MAGARPSPSLPLAIAQAIASRFAMALNPLEKTLYGRALDGRSASGLALPS